ncbi:MAG: hypothetical protein IPM82_28830 [Saprospiraceae bacterium]|nr:hypothetical protein [Saprospiraceae bacterium]
MKKTFFLLLLFALPLLHSCGEHGQHGNSAVQITLDNGNRWQANPETTSGIAAMRAICEIRSKTADAANRRPCGKNWKPPLTHFQTMHHDGRSA